MNTLPENTNWEPQKTVLPESETDNFFNKKIYATVKVEPKGTKLIMKPEELSDFFKDYLPDMSEDEFYYVGRISLTDEEFKNLGDFPGF